MLTYKQRRDMIVTHAWETWTQNGLKLDSDMKRETAKTVRNKTINSYYDGISDIEWLKATLKALESIRIGALLVPSQAE
jgi:hypothetical protein